jgi:hypothetical protein
MTSGKRRGRGDGVTDSHHVISPLAPLAPIQPTGQNVSLRSILRPLTLSAIAVFLFAASAWVLAQDPTQAPTAQTPAKTTTSTQKPTHFHKRPSPAHPATTPAPDVPVPVAPPAPEPPKWPAFDHPAQASVVWDSHGLSIDAANSSLQQILKDVSTATGVKVEGMASDQRVFGTYGPGQARDVLSQLLQGSGYNVIMIGDQGQGTPRQLLLSARQSGGAQPAPRNNQTNEEDEADEQPVTPEPEPVRPAFPPGAPPRSPQQVMQEMQERRREMQQNQQNQQPNQPPANPQY